MNSNSKRIEQLINKNWKFMYGDIPEGRNSLHDDSSWYDIGIPHSFCIPYFMENEFYVGYGCYRKVLSIQPEWLDKVISLEFQAAFQDAEIYINGILAGTHKGGYTAFVVDISSFVQKGENLLFVRLNNLWNPRLAPRAGEHVFNGGLYRDVSLIVTEPVHVAWYGTSITTPEVSAQQASVEIRTEIVNEMMEAADCIIVSTVEFQGEQVFKISQKERLQPGQSYEILQQHSVDAPKLWHPDRPNLYVLKSQIYLSDILYDEIDTTFGIRRFSFDAKEGFTLNGEHYDILGANVHQDHAGWGDAVTRAGIQRDVQLIKDCGMNFIRGSHYPHHPFFAAECDRQGILFWSELCFWGIGGANVEGYWTSSAYPIHEEDKSEFEESCLLTLREMIRTNRNHPCVIAWSMSNEPFFSDEEVMDEARALVVRLVNESHLLDSSRPAAVGGAQRQGFDALGDIAGYNGDGASLYQDPGFASFVSEYGSTVSERPGEYTPSYTDGVEDNPVWRSGKALWCGFHHGSFVFDMGSMGMIDYYRLPLNSWYWYRNELLGIAPPPAAVEGIPYALRLKADKKTIATDGTDDTQLIVELTDREGKRISNTAAVTLEIVEGGGLFPTGNNLLLSPEQGGFLDGTGAIEMRAYYAGSIRVEARAEGVQSAQITIQAVGGEEWAGQKLNMPVQAPSIMKIPGSGSSTIISKNRPVFCSSFAAGYPAMNVTDAREDSCWKSGEQRTGEWIMVDLEGRKTTDKAIITFVENSKVPFEISYSFNGKQFKPLEISASLNGEQSISVELPSGGLRYLRVSFPLAPADVQEIEIYS